MKKEGIITLAVVFVCCFPSMMEAVADKVTLNAIHNHRGIKLT